jgi:ankyrin repeat protein
MNDPTPMSSPWPEPPDGQPPVRQRGPVTVGHALLALLGVMLIVAVASWLTREQAATPDEALDRAVVARDLAGARAAIGRGANVNQTDLSGSTPLHSAAWRGDLAMAALLVEQGARVNHADSRSGETPLHSAARGNQPGMVKYLLDHGANPGLRTHADSPQCNGIIYPAGVDALAIARQSGFGKVTDVLSP